MHIQPESFRVLTAVRCVSLGPYSRQAGRYPALIVHQCHSDEFFSDILALGNQFEPFSSLECSAKTTNKLKWSTKWECYRNPAWSQSSAHFKQTMWPHSRSRILHPSIIEHSTHFEYLWPLLSCLIRMVSVSVLPFSACPDSVLSGSDHLMFLGLYFANLFLPLFRNIDRISLKRTASLLTVKNRLNCMEARI